jgi:hypothetical protein
MIAEVPIEITRTSSNAVLMARLTPSASDDNTDTPGGDSQSKPAQA